MSDQLLARTKCGSKILEWKWWGLGLKQVVRHEKSNIEHICLPRYCCLNWHTINWYKIHDFQLHTCKYRYKLIDFMPYPPRQICPKRIQELTKTPNSFGSPALGIRIVSQPFSSHKNHTGESLNSARRRNRTVIIFISLMIYKHLTHHRSDGWPIQNLPWSLAQCQQCTGGCCSWAQPVGPKS